MVYNKFFTSSWWYYSFGMEATGPDNVNQPPFLRKFDFFFTKYNFSNFLIHLRRCVDLNVNPPAFQKILFLVMVISSYGTDFSAQFHMKSIAKFCYNELDCKIMIKKSYFGILCYHSFFAGITETICHFWMNEWKSRWNSLMNMVKGTKVEK